MIFKVVQYMSNKSENLVHQENMIVTIEYNSKTTEDELFYNTL